MTSYDEEVTSLIAQIAVAFHDVIRGAGISLHEAKVLDDYGGDAARLEARGWDTDSHWWEVSDKDLLDTGLDYCYFDGRSFHYYLPAFMIHSLKILSTPLTGISDTRDYTLDMLSFFDQNDQDRRVRLQECYPYRFREYRYVERHDFGTREKQMWALLTAAQSRVVCLYLQFVVIHGADSRYIRDAQKGLQQHWGQFYENSLPE